MLSLRSTVVRNLYRTNLVRVSRVPIVSVRFQSTVQETVQESSTINTTTEKESTSRPKARHHPKVWDISNQITETINSPTTDLVERISILDEGLSYLKSIQESERITDKSLNQRFSSIVSKVLSMAIENNNTPEHDRVEQVLEILIRNGVANRYHFTAAAADYMKHDNSAYEKVLSLWIRCLESEKEDTSRVINSSILLQLEYKPYYLPNLVYFSYIQMCQAQNVKISLPDLLKLLQRETLPSPFLVKNTLNELRLENCINQFDGFYRAVKAAEFQNLDPNGPLIYKTITKAVETRNVSKLRYIFNEARSAAAKNKTYLSDVTMARFMDAYFELGQFDQVFELFNNMLDKGFKPTTRIWNVVLRTMGNPDYVKDSPNKEVLVANLEKAIASAITPGSVSAKTLSIIISGFATLDRFDLVDSYLDQYVTKGQIPLIDPIKNNILLGLLFNKKVQEAEKKLDEYRKAGDYIPSTSVLNSFLYAYSKAGNAKAVEGLIKYMKKENIPETVATHTIFIDYFFKSNQEKGLMADVDQLLETLNNAKNFKLNDATYTAIIDGLIQNSNNIEAARQIFAKAIAKYPGNAHLYVVMMKGEIDIGSLRALDDLFETYTTSVKNEIRIWNMIIKMLLYKNIGLAQRYYARLLGSTTVKPNYFTFYFLLNFFSRRDDKDEVQKILNDLASNPISELGDQLPSLLERLSLSYKVDPKLLSK
ncbi:uncharacterized protein RJT21DRAFT_112009 [Scheffersomyces amazonensis]|uniref:uncharacterized protein n=1 Tax=Scheffersomyces amazonensis TaxID=1078765 RepID=UPI00315D5153